MIKTLRRRHLQIWYLLAFLLPLCVVVAWMAVPEKPVNTLLQPSLSASILKLAQSIEKKNYTINIRCTENRDNCQLEYINRHALTIPSLLIYIMKPGAQTIDEHDLLGRIESRGSYYFPLPAAGGNEATGFILYDFIHQRIIDTIVFKDPSVQWR
jgi:hypothetical protein